MFDAPAQHEYRRRAIDEAQAAIDELAKLCDATCEFRRPHIHAIEGLRRLAESLRSTFGLPELARSAHVSLEHFNMLSRAIWLAMNDLGPPIAFTAGGLERSALLRLYTWAATAMKEAA